MRRQFDFRCQWESRAQDIQTDRFRNGGRGVILGATVAGIAVGPSFGLAGTVLLVVGKIVFQKHVVVLIGNCDRFVPACAVPIFQARRSLVNVG